jgi:membrane protein
MDPIARGREYLDWLISRPVAELSRFQRWLRFAVDLTRHCSRELSPDQAGQMAAALTYRTIFSLVPLLLVSTVAFRVFGDVDQAFGRLRSATYDFVDYPVENGRPEALAFKAELDRQLAAVTDAVAGLSFEAIGGVGLLLLIWAALGLLINLEQSANTIYRAPQGRGSLQRVVVYWSVVTLGPLVLFVVLYAADFWSSWLQALPVLGPAFGSLRRFGSIGASFLLLLLLYKLMPNTHVRLRPAVSGALVAALLWESTKFAFGLYVSRALPYSKLYGAIGLIPLFLFWLYLNWLIVLFGLELAFTLQAMKGRDFERLDERGQLEVGNPLWVVPIMTAIAHGFERGQPVGRQDLAEEVGLPLEAVAELALKLEEAGLVYQVPKRGSDDVGLTLALPPDRIALATLLELGGRLVLGPGERRAGPGWQLLQSLQESARSSVGEQTLARLLGPEA